MVTTVLINFGASRCDVRSGLGPGWLGALWSTNIAGLHVTLSLLKIKQSGFVKLYR